MKLHVIIYKHYYLRNLINCHVCVKRLNTSSQLCTLQVTTNFTALFVAVSYHAVYEDRVNLNYFIIAGQCALITSPKAANLHI